MPYEVLIQTCTLVIKCSHLNVTNNSVFFPLYAEISYFVFKWLLPYQTITIHSTHPHPMCQISCPNLLHLLLSLVLFKYSLKKSTCHSKFNDHNSTILFQVCTIKFNIWRLARKQKKVGKINEIHKTKGYVFVLQSNISKDIN